MRLGQNMAVGQASMTALRNFQLPKSDRKDTRFLKYINNIRILVTGYNLLDYPKLNEENWLSNLSFLDNHSKNDVTTHGIKS